MYRDTKLLTVADLARSATILLISHPVQPTL